MILLRSINTTSTVVHRYLVNSDSSNSSHIISVFCTHQRHSATVQHRSQLFTETFSSQAVEVEVDGMVHVHQQEADGLHEQVTRRIYAGRHRRGRNSR